MKTILLAFALVIPSVAWSQNLEFYQRAQIQNQLAYQSQILTEINNRQRREDMAIQNEEMAAWRAQKDAARQYMPTPIEAMSRHYNVVAPAAVNQQGGVGQANAQSTQILEILADALRRRDAAQQELEAFRQSQARAATLNVTEKTQSPAVSGR